MQGGDFSAFYKKAPKNPKRLTLRSKKAQKGKNVTLRRQKGGGCACESVSNMPHSLGGYFLKSAKKSARRNQKKTRK